MRATALAIITILSLAACGGDDANTTGPGSGGSGGASGSGGSAGSGGASGTSGGGAGTAGSGGGNGGQAGSTPGDASAPRDVRADTPTGTNDAAADRPA